MGTAAEQSWAWYGDAVLFDLDGTLVDSGPAVSRNWHWVADELGVPFTEFEPYLHGIPTEQVLRIVLPNWDEAELRAFAARQLIREAADSDDVRAIAGAIALLEGLPSNRWAIVTSGDHRLATTRIRAAGLPMPRVLVTSEHVTAGKPNPAPYLLAASRLGYPPARCLVVEDAPAGVESGRAAGMHVVGVLTSSPALPETSHEVDDLTSVVIEVDRLGVRVSAT